MADVNGIESSHFRAFASGHTVLYSRDGRLLFEGGITISRGHEGENLGEDLIASLLNGTATKEAHTPIFGCSLLSTPSTYKKSLGDAER
jgi:hypothetical protein